MPKTCWPTVPPWRQVELFLRMKRRWSLRRLEEIEPKEEIEEKMYYHQLEEMEPEEIEAFVHLRPKSVSD